MWLAFVITTLAVAAISGCGTMPVPGQPSQPAVSRVEPLEAHSVVVQSLQRQVRERDRRIAELTFQLEALKAIDREAESRRQQSRFPGGGDR